MWETKSRAGKGLDGRSGTNLQTGRTSQFVQHLCITRPCPSPPAEAPLQHCLPLPLQLQLSLDLTQDKLPTSTASSCTVLAPSAGNVAQSRSSAPSLHFGGLQMASQFSGCTLRADNLHTLFALEQLVGKLTPDGSNQLTPPRLARAKQAT